MTGAVQTDTEDNEAGTVPESTSRYNNGGNHCEEQPVCGWGMFQ